MSDVPNPTEFIRNLYEVEEVSILSGIHGRSGVYGLPPGLGLNENMGIDLIDMEPGTAFPAHTHPGAHILFILRGEGTVSIGEATRVTRPGDCYFIPANIPHRVGAIQHHQLLSIGFPHRALDDPRRMDIISDEDL